MLALFAPNATVLGTGPGEIWGGHEEIASAYGHFFENFDAGKQKSEVLFRDGHVIGDMAWLLSMSKVSMTKGAKTIERQAQSQRRWLDRPVLRAHCPRGLGEQLDPDCSRQRLLPDDPLLHPQRGRVRRDVEAGRPRADEVGVLQWPQWAALRPSTSSHRFFDNSWKPGEIELVK